MPTYSINGPDGKTYSIEGPEGATRDQVIAKIKEKMQPPSASEDKPSMLGDVAKSFGRGVAKGAIGLAGLPGDVARMEGEGIKWLGGKMGLPAPEGNTDPSLLPSSQDIQGGVEKLTGKFDTPKTTAGKYAQSVGEFVPSAAIGPGGLATKAATTVAGGVGAEAGGEAFGELGRFAGGLAGGTIAGFPSAEAQAMKLSKRLPSTDAIKQSSQNAYDMVKNAKLTASPTAVGDFVNNAKSALDNDLIVDTSAPRTFKALDKLENAGGDIGQIMGVRQKLGEISPTEGTDYYAAQHVKHAIDDFVETLSPQNVISGDPKFTSAMLNHARSSWRAYRKVDEIEHIGELAEHRSKATGTGANYVNVVRQEVRKILDSDKRSRGYSPEAKKKMEEIVLGTFATNRARNIGKFAPSGAVSAIPSILATIGIGPGTGAGVAIGGFIAKHLGNYLTNRQLRELADVIRGEAPMAKTTAAQNAKEAPNFKAILPAAAGRAALETSADKSQKKSMSELAGQ